MANLLIADDEPEVRKRLRSQLEKAGHAAAVASDGEAALERVLDAPPDLLLVDWMMPELTGGEVTKRIRRNHRYDAVKTTLIIGMTDLAEESALNVFLDCGADDVWEKDLSAEGMSRLQTKVEALLGKDGT